MVPIQTMLRNMFGKGAHALTTQELENHVATLEGAVAQAQEEATDAAIHSENILADAALVPDDPNAAEVAAKARAAARKKEAIAEEARSALLGARRRLERSRASDRKAAQREHAQRIRNAADERDRAAANVEELMRKVGPAMGEYAAATTALMAALPPKLHEATPILYRSPVGLATRGLRLLSASSGGAVSAGGVLPREYETTLAEPLDAWRSTSDHLRSHADAAVGLRGPPELEPQEAAT